MASPRTDLNALRRILEQAYLLIASDSIPAGGRERAAELLKSAMA